MNSTERRIETSADRTLIHELISTALADEQRPILGYAIAQIVNDTGRTMAELDFIGPLYPSAAAARQALDEDDQPKPGEIVIEIRPISADDYEAARAIGQRNEDGHELH